jgi:hypothetical protein
LRQEGFGESLDRLAAGGTVIPPKSADLDTVERAWREALAQHSRGLLQAEIETAWNDFAEGLSEEKRGRDRAKFVRISGIDVV